MKFWKLASAATALALSTSVNAASITVIESQSESSGRDMDTSWLNVANSMGHTGNISQQTTLDNTDFFSSTDMLIVSSGTISLSSSRVNTITQYLQQGGSVYLQGEYQATYSTNAAFETITESLGGDFTWSGAVEGTLPVNVLGDFSNSPNAVSTIDGYWYGAAGYGDSTIENFLEYNGDYLGFVFTSHNSSYGQLITTTDQDWVRTLGSTANNQLLMENIIAGSVSTVPVPAAAWLFGSGLIGLVGFARRKKA